MLRGYATVLCINTEMKKRKNEIFETTIFTFKIHIYLIALDFRWVVMLSAATCECFVFLSLLIVCRRSRTNPLLHFYVRLDVKMCCAANNKNNQFCLQLFSLFPTK